ncbi:hypothetical protein ICJ77_16390 [Acidiphilium multivorum]|nr:hypothetical protein [Acidiphilium multivorum]
MTAFEPPSNLANSHLNSTGRPRMIFTPSWGDYFGSAIGLYGNDGLLHLIDRLRSRGFRIVILCSNSQGIARRFPDTIDQVLPLRGMGDWVFRKLCIALCGRAREPHPWDRGDVTSAATPLVLNMAWRPGMSPEVLRIRVLETARELRVQGD